MAPRADPLALKPIEWMGSTRDDLRELPEEPRRRFGYGLHEAQLGRHPRGAKPLRGALAGLVELIDDFDGNTYRAVYTVKLAGVVYVLHVFQKKSTRGIATPKRELDVIRERWQRATVHYAEHYPPGGPRHG
ncbi:MAG: type II toxin-antitoxin system RelE/ParE family toxin [Gemmatimonadaceae bacterium]